MIYVPLISIGPTHSDMIEKENDEKLKVGNTFFIRH